MKKNKYTQRSIVYTYVGGPLLHEHAHKECKFSFLRSFVLPISDLICSPSPLLSQQHRLADQPPLDLAPPKFLHQHQKVTSLNPSFVLLQAQDSPQPYDARLLNHQTKNKELNSLPLSLTHTRNNWQLSLHNTHTPSSQLIPKPQINHQQLSFSLCQKKVHLSLPTIGNY